MIFLGAFLLSMMAVLALTPALRGLAKHLHFLDYPNTIKVHKTPTPLMGGIAVALASLASAAAALALINYPYSAKIVGFMSGGLIVLVLGLADDANGMRPAVKLTGQAVAAAVMMFSGGLSGLPFHPVISFVLGLIWMVGLMNAFNFLDNMDGLSSGVAAICAAALLGASASMGQVFVSAWLCLILGAVAGYLPYNFPPASTFMGDAGSLVIGYLLAVVSCLTTYVQPGQTYYLYGVFVPLVVMAVPLYDLVSVVFLRIRGRANPMVGDQRHFSHRLVDRGLSRRLAVMTIYLATATTGLAATLLPGADLQRTITVAIMVVMVLAIVAILESPLRNSPPKKSSDARSQ
ncbi:undecaprenyl/decaprenyl-phosphate alpha-N-acetylglucosaminyl 1-phosphate transferase [bacterium]|nr:undecaprenyl/decaprenyl-phosphate alpha-N-acetylglucosaminyl 1-phosphate transferase [bacterium]